MKHLTHLDREGRRELAERVEQACVVFPNTALPEGCVPSHARVGVETGSEGKVLLHVERGCVYLGDDAAIQHWIDSGTTTFDSLDGIWTWIEGWPYARSLAVPYAIPTVDYDRVTVPDRTRITIPDRSALLDALGSKIFGQDVAVETIAGAVARHLAQRKPLRPLTIMALGPTGTGKTATAEALSESLSELTEGEYGTVRLDMVEFQEAHSTARLFGSPPGYIGYRDGGSLADALSENQRCVVIIDEIEKAHRNVLVALMALMDTGKIAGGGEHSHSGVDARRSVLMFTSNLAVEEFSAVAQAVTDSTEIDRLGRVHLRRNGIPPEIVGRLHHVVAFQSLDDLAQARVVADMIGRCGRAYGFNVSGVGPEVVSHLLEDAHDEPSGARSLAFKVDAAIGDLFSEGVRQGAEGTVQIVGVPAELEELDTACLEEIRPAIDDCPSKERR